MKRAGVAVLFLCCVVASAFSQTAPALRAVYVPGSYINLNWTYAGTNYYRVNRTPGGAGWPAITNQLGFTEFSPPANVAYVYQVTPSDISGNALGPSSNKAFATTFTFTDSPLVVSTTRFKAGHITELRTALSAIASVAGASSPSWTYSTIGGNTPLYAANVQDLRNAWIASVAAMGISPAPPFEDPALGNTVRMKRAHIEQLRQRVQAFPLDIGIGASITNRYFSPNADGHNDTTSVSGVVSRLPNSVVTDFRWIVNVRNSVGAIVRSASGMGDVGYAWDGRNTAGSIQPEGDYAIEIVDADGIAAPLWTGVTTIDLTAPLATISSPASNQQFSNVHQSGTSIVAITGSASDSHFGTWTVSRSQNGQPGIGLGSGSAAAAAGTTLANWDTIPSGVPLANGAYTLTLLVTDLAGNTTSTSVDAVIANFSASLATHQLNAAGGESAVFTSIVPFTLTQTLVITTLSGTVVRTLVNAQRVSGTYSDSWNGTNDQGVLVPDGSYKYTATATDAIGTVTWDQGNIAIGTFAAVAQQYVKCRNDAGARVECSDPSIVFDPYANRPLRINYCVGDIVHDPPNCVGGLPHYVVVKVSNIVEDTGQCDSGCISAGFEAAGEHEVAWWGMSTQNVLVAAMPRVLVLRSTASFPANVLVVYGTAPQLSNVVIDKPIFYPGGTPLTITIPIQTFQGRSVVLSVQFRSVMSGTVLRSLVTAASSAVSQTVQWNGRADGGQLVAPGLYEVVIVATDTFGNTATARPLMTVKY
ncbi:MAG: hypothetical protein QOI24_1306 [Acidobacteriota bacterium]|jgi:flagellar hook assembly protein FlgD|nr:hypothetical protein [Acidobacteriota bacterium]